ncbi:MAG: peptidylprolyl isomerase [Bryobacterales bacterium]|nr:peptidylprolyl isomerase [Bryobacterales bacterium]
MRKYLLAAAAFAAVSAPAADVQLLEEIIAKINGDIITRTEIEKSRTQLRAELVQRGLKGEQLEKEYKERENGVLANRIDQLLLQQKGRDLSISVDAEVSKQVNEIMRQYKITDPEALAKLVREQTGMPFEDYKNDMKNSMVTQRVIQQEVGSKINIPKPEKEAYYNEHKNEFQREERIFLRELLVGTEGKDAAGVAAAEKKAKDLVARARKGERFPDLVRDNSDAASVREDGYLGAFKRGDLKKELEDVLWAQQRNFVTDPIKVDNGFLILKIEERHKAGLAALEEVESEISEKLYMTRFQPKIREYLTALRQDAFLEIKEGWADTSAAPGKETKWTDPAQLKPETVTKEEVAANPRRKRLLWLVPIPGTSSKPKE